MRDTSTCTSLQAALLVTSTHLKGGCFHRAQSLSMTSIPVFLGKPSNNYRSDMDCHDMLSPHSCYITIQTHYSGKPNDRAGI